MAPGGHHEGSLLCCWLADCQGVLTTLQLSKACLSQEIITAAAAAATFQFQAVSRDDSPHRQKLKVTVAVHSCVATSNGFRLGMAANSRKIIFRSRRSACINACHGHIGTVSAFSNAVTAISHS